MSKIRVTLDWTPNTNHSGLYVAQSLGYFNEVGLDVELVPPSKDYTKEETPARQVSEGRADICICSSESVISCWTRGSSKPRIVAVATIVQDCTCGSTCNCGGLKAGSSMVSDCGCGQLQQERVGCGKNAASAIVATKQSGIQFLKDLDGKRYASYGGRFEMGMIQRIVKNAGGEGNVIEVKPSKLDCMDAVLRGEADAIWIFNAWESMLCDEELTVFPMTVDCIGFRYGYSPVIAVHPDMMQGDRADQLRAFLQAVANGYHYATDYAAEALTALTRASDHHSLLELHTGKVFKSQEYLSMGKYYLNGEGVFGVMNASRWEAFVNWLVENQIILDRDGKPIEMKDIDVSKMFTNEFLPSR